MKAMIFAAAALLLSACDRRQPTNDADHRLPIPATNPPSPPLAPQPRPPEPTVDPKSRRAAEDLVQALAGLLNARKFDEAYMLLGPPAPPRKQFDGAFARYTHLRVAAGTAGDQEGAAGSIYVSVPLTISGITSDERVNRSATAILRRVNDVPGSSETQRRWHIERIDWGDGR